MAIIYPEKPTKVLTIEKEGYNSVSIIEDNKDNFVVQLYNPNVRLEESGKGGGEE